MTKDSISWETERGLQDECDVADFTDKRACAKWDDIPKSRDPGFCETRVFPRTWNDVHFWNSRSIRRIGPGNN